MRANIVSYQIQIEGELGNINKSTDERKEVFYLIDNLDLLVLKMIQHLKIIAKNRMFVENILLPFKNDLLY